MEYLGLSKKDWEPKLSMAPRVVLTPKNDGAKRKIKRLDQIKINRKRINHYVTSTGDIRLDIMLVNQSAISIYEGEAQVQPEELGIENVHLQDSSGSYAYHVPEGILLHCNPRKKMKGHTDNSWTSVSALDFAPSILKKYSVDIPSYMQSENLFLC